MHSIVSCCWPVQVMATNLFNLTHPDYSKAMCVILQQLQTRLQQRLTASAAGASPRDNARDIVTFETESLWLRSLASPDIAPLTQPGPADAGTERRLEMVPVHVVISAVHPSLVPPFVHPGQARAPNHYLLCMVTPKSSQMIAQLATHISNQAVTAMMRAAAR